MRTVIFGLAKSGTTALFYKIKNSLPPDTICLFEPRSFDSRAVRMKSMKALLLRGRKPDVLAKILPFRPSAPADAESFSAFEKQVLIVRDPRDRLISRLLYGVYGSNFYRDDDKVEAFLELLRQKEADARTVSLATLLKTFARLNGESFSLDTWAADYRRHSIQRPLDFYEKHPKLFAYRYEEMVEQKFEGLKAYLGVPLKGEAFVPPPLERIARTKSHGQWRDWLTPEDVGYLRPILQPFLNRHYREADWELNPSPAIPAEHGSLYVERIVNDRRALEKLPPFRRE